MSSVGAAKAGGEGTAVILGASGAVGKHLLSLLVGTESPYSTVLSFARRPHPSPPPVSPHVTFSEILVDFDAIHSGSSTELSKLTTAPTANSVFITMGTTRAAAGSMSAFELIDREYVLSTARALHKPSSNQTVLYCSSSGSSSSSPFPYLKSKGLTEQGLASTFPHAIIFKPGYLANAERPGTRILEKLSAPLFGLLAIASDSAQADVKYVAKAMVRAAQMGTEELKNRGLGVTPGEGFKLEQGKGRDGVAVVGNASVLKLAKE
ncbi:Protein FMP52, mitochondrial [Pseudozyma hubeiensis]|nr:Protein FMP52, mitochondrial [Pseudozyma hubeiensis]